MRIVRSSGEPPGTEPRQVGQTWSQSKRKPKSPLPSSASDSLGEITAPVGSGSAGSGSPSNTSEFSATMYCPPCAFAVAVPSLIALAT